MSADFAKAASAAKITISTQYNSADYWTARYTADGEQFDWFLRFASFAHVLETVATKSSTIVDVGCGTSRLVADLVAAGYGHARPAAFETCFSTRKTPKSPGCRWRASTRAPSRSIV